MIKPEFISLELHGTPAGDISVFADGKALGTLFYRDGVACVALYPQVVRTVGKKVGAE